MSKASPNSRFHNTDYPDLPDGWRWIGGNLSNVTYTQWFETDYRMGGNLAGRGKRLGGYSGEIDFDTLNDRGYTVLFYPVTSMAEDEYLSSYPDVQEEFETMQEAVDAVPRLIDELPERINEYG